eukprot:6957386-Alexandrium_andersonii.AAC.1
MYSCVGTASRRTPNPGHGPGSHRETLPAPGAQRRQPEAAPNPTKERHPGRRMARWEPWRYPRIAPEQRRARAWARQTSTPTAPKNWGPPASEGMAAPSIRPGHGRGWWPQPPCSAHDGGD